MYYFVSYIIKIGSKQLNGRCILNVSPEFSFKDKNALSDIEDCICEAINPRKVDCKVILTNLTPLPHIEDDTQSELKIDKIKTIDNTFGTI